MLPNLGAAIYGLISVSALLAAEQGARETYGETIEAVGLVLLLYWLAHGYAEFASSRVRASEPLRASALARTMLHELPIIAGAAIPLLPVLVDWAIGAPLSSATAAALWTGAGLIVIIEVTAAIRAKLSRAVVLLQAAVGAALGLLVLALRFALH